MQTKITGRVWKYGDGGDVDGSDCGSERNVKAMSHSSQPALRVISL